MKDTRIIYFKPEAKFKDVILNNIMRPCDMDVHRRHPLCRQTTKELNGDLGKRNAIIWLPTSIGRPEKRDNMGLALPKTGSGASVGLMQSGVYQNAW